MSKQLGLMLVREKIISRTQLDRAQDLAEKAKIGLVQALLDQNTVDDGLLAVFVSEKLKIPFAEKGQIEHAGSALLRVMSKDLADEFNAVPIGMEKNTLKIAMVDPTDSLAVDEIQFFLGRRVLPYIGARQVVYESLRKNFGLSRPENRASTAKPAPAPPPTPENVPKKIPNNIPQKMIDQEPRSAAPPASPPPIASPLIIDAAEEESLDHLMQKLGGSVVTSPKIEPLGLTHPVPPIPTSQAVSSPSSSPAHIASPILNFDELHRDTLGKMDAAKDKDEIAAIFLDFANHILDRVAVFAIKKNVLLGWLGKGVGLDEKSLKGIMIPLNSPSLFQRVKDTKVYYFGEVPPSTVNQIFLTAIGGVKPPNVILIPLAIKDKVFAIFYGDQGSLAIPTTHLHYLHLLIPKVESSFGSLIVQMKTKK